MKRNWEAAAYQQAIRKLASGELVIEEDPQYADFPDHADVRNAEDRLLNDPRVVHVYPVIFLPRSNNGMEVPNENLWSPILFAEKLPLWVGMPLLFLGIFATLPTMLWWIIGPMEALDAWMARIEPHSSSQGDRS